MIKVLLFAQLQESAGKSEVSLDGAGLTIAQLKARLSTDFHLEGLDSVMTAVNEEFADDETALEDGDTVAFIPPVSGG
ncbi:molybdopterin converting factor subunit 1 [Bacillus massiliglaciei]|uniref:molybdopterin converting factor subunit 1 n=1 Tax=Bacillus massiliglaciei TaxID=1816693 RepID=UPI000A6F9E0E|nr:molybdopterin converting factor subunit 1 [Bacillus massiliglaciei]